MLGVGIVVVCPLAAALSPRAGAVTVLVGCGALVGAAALFWLRPFGSDAQRHPSGVRQLPRRWHLVYIAGFCGGSGYLVTIAAALLHLTLSGPVWPAWLVAIAGTALWASVPPAPAGLKVGLALVALVLGTLNSSLSAAVGRQAVGQAPVVTVLFGTALLAVGWEQLAARHRPEFRRTATAVASCVIIVAAGYLFVRLAPLHVATAPARHLAAPVAAAILLLLLIGNIRAIAGFWIPPTQASAPRSTVAAVAATVITIAALVRLAGLAPTWLLVAPGLATLTLYLGFAARRPRAVAAAEPR